MEKRIGSDTMPYVEWQIPIRLVKDTIYTGGFLNEKILALLVAGVMVLSVNITASAKSWDINWDLIDDVYYMVKYGGVTFDYDNETILNPEKKYYLSQKLKDGKYSYPGNVSYDTSSKKCRQRKRSRV